MQFLKGLLRTKPLAPDDVESTGGLKRVLSAFDLTLLGIGAIIGAGIFVLTGIAAATHSGPAVILSYLLAGIVSAFAALSYAELATSIGGCGSAYGYAFAGLGEVFAWIIGWDLLLEYGTACSAVAAGWSAYVNNALSAIGIRLPAYLLQPPGQGGIVDLPAVLIIFLICVLLAVGVKQSTKINNIIVFIKLAVIALFIGIASFHFNVSNWHPFVPFGWMGVVQGAALIFFAYIGFDAVSTAAEEAIRPQRDLPLGIILSLVVCIVLYMIVAGLLTGMTHYTNLNVSSPVSAALLHYGFRLAAGTVAIGAIAGLTTVILVMYYGLTRVFLAMSRDGLLPAPLAAVNKNTHTPVRIIIIAGIIMALIAGFIPMIRIAELVNIGTLAAFAVVCAGVIIMRYTKPNIPRPFKTPLMPLIPLCGVVLTIYLMIHLPSATWWRFVIWMIVGLVIYFAYSYRHSALKKK